MNNRWHGADIQSLLYIYRMCFRWEHEFLEKKKVFQMKHIQRIPFQWKYIGGIEFGISAKPFSKIEIFT